MQLASFEASWPVLSAIKWDRQYHAMLATPLRVRDVVLGHQAFIAFRLLLTATVYFVVITAFGAVESPLGVLAIPVAVLVGLVVLDAASPRGRHTRRTRCRSSRSSGSSSSRCSSSRGRSSRSRRLPAPLEVIAYLTPLWHGVTLCRELTLGDVVPWLALVHVAYLLACVAVGSRARAVSRTGGGSSSDDRARRPRPAHRSGAPGDRRAADRRAERDGLPADLDDPLLRLLRAALLPLLLRLPAPGVHRGRHVRRARRSSTRRSSRPRCSRRRR